MKFDLKLIGFIERQNYEWHANKQKNRLENNSKFRETVKLIQKYAMK